MNEILNNQNIKRMIVQMVRSGIVHNSDYSEHKLGETNLLAAVSNKRLCNDEVYREK